MPRRFLPRQVLNILNLLLRTRKTYSRFFSVDYPQYFYLETHLTKVTYVIQQKNNNSSDSYCSSTLLSEESKQRIRFANLGEKNNSWKGDDVGYWGLHKWINRNRPKPQSGKCGICNNRSLRHAVNVTGIYERFQELEICLQLMSCETRLHE